MASPSPKRAPTPRQHPPRPPAGPPEIVNPIWLLKAAAITVAAAIFCAWLTLCLLVYQGQWQLLLHPDTNPKLSTTLPIQPIRFGATETGQPRLAGLWLPAAPSSAAQIHPPSSFRSEAEEPAVAFPSPPLPTILYLPDGSGRLADDLPTLTQLHQLPVDIFAFDYRGFGASDPTPHPTQLRMAEDAASALDFLINTRHLDPHTIIPYGVGLGASLAATLCQQHPELPALIVESPLPNPFALAATDPRSRFVPLSLLFHERFEIASTLQSLKTPKLLLTAGPSHTFTPSDQFAIDSLYRGAATPSYIVHLSPWQPSSAAPYRESILRFLNEYVPASQPAQGPTP